MPRKPKGPDAATRKSANARGAWSVGAPKKRKRRNEETALSAAIRNTLTAKGCLVVRVNSGSVEAKNGGWVHGAKKGTPDLLVIRPRTSVVPYARYTHLEVKKKTGEPTREQLEWLEWAELNGASAFVVRGIQEAIDAVFGRRQ